MVLGYLSLLISGVATTEYDPSDNMGMPVYENLGVPVHDNLAVMLEHEDTDESQQEAQKVHEPRSDAEPEMFKFDLDECLQARTIIRMTLDTAHTDAVG